MSYTSHPDPQHLNPAEWQQLLIAKGWGYASINPTSVQADGPALTSGIIGLVNRGQPRKPEDLFAPLAHSAATLFAEADRNRIRKCGQCVLHFYDTSKKGTRRWCSMQLCGNRAKVAAYAARRRGEQD